MTLLYFYKQHASPKRGTSYVESKEGQAVAKKKRSKGRRRELAKRVSEERIEKRALRRRSIVLALVKLLEDDFI